MRPFKFFQREVKSDLIMFDGQIHDNERMRIRYDGSLHIPPLQDWDTPQGHNHRRMLYHTNPAQYEIQRQIREELRTRLREGGFTEEERIRYRNDAFERMRNTNDDMERYFIEHGFRDLNDNPVEPPVIKPKSKISKFIDWCQKYEHLIPISIGLGIIATFMIYFR
jgi:hypothetical protein